MGGYSLSTISRGFSVLQPNDSMPEDSIVILPGGRTPFVLRPLVDSEEYQLVEPCYVHCIMNDELFEDGTIYQKRIVLGAEKELSVTG